MYIFGSASVDVDQTTWSVCPAIEADSVIHVIVQPMIPPKTKAPFRQKKAENLAIYTHFSRWSSDRKLELVQYLNRLIQRSTNVEHRDL